MNTTNTSTTTGNNTNDDSHHYDPELQDVEIKPEDRDDTSIDSTSDHGDGHVIVAVVGDDDDNNKSNSAARKDSSPPRCLRWMLLAALLVGIALTIGLGLGLSNSNRVGTQKLRVPNDSGASAELDSIHDNTTSSSSSSSEDGLEDSTTEAGDESPDEEDGKGDQTNDNGNSNGMVPIIIGPATKPPSGDVDLNLPMKDRQVWPELVDMHCDEALETLRDSFQEQYYLELIHSGQQVTKDFRFDRVRIFVDDNCIVTDPPSVGRRR